MHSEYSNWKSDLDRQGYCLLRQFTAEDRNSLGHVVNITDVRPVARPVDMFPLNTFFPISMHTEPEFVRYVLWNCIHSCQQEGGKTLLLDFLSVWNALSEAQRNDLSRPARSSEQRKKWGDSRWPMALDTDGKMKFFWQPQSTHWIKNTHSEAIAAFAHEINHQSPVVLELKPGDFLVVNNWRMLHGRTPIKDPGRHIRRFWLAADPSTKYSYHSCGGSLKPEEAQEFLKSHA